MVFLSCNFKRLIFCKKRLPELKKEKKSHLPLVEIILSAQSFILLLKRFIATAVVMQAFFCICICICCTADKKKVPLAAAAAAMQGVFVGRGRAGVGKKIAPVLPARARGKKTPALQSSIRTNARKCLPANLDKKLFKTSKK